MAKFMSLLQLLFFVAAYGSGEFAARFAERSGMQPLAAQLYMVTPTWTWGVALFALHGWSPFTARVLALAQLFAGGVASMRGIQPTSRTQQRYLTYPIIGSISGVALSTVVGPHANGMVALLGVMLHVFSCIHEVVWRVILPAPIVAEFANVPYLQARHEQRPNVALFSIASSGSPGVTISGAIAKAPEQFGRPPRILLYLGGNAELWEHSLVPIAAFANKRLGADAVLLNYRGVGTSGGVTRTAEGMAVDASDVIKYLLASTPGLLESDILLFGHSIGGGVAAIVVDKYHRQCSVVLDRTFSSLPDAAKGVVPRLPLSLIRPVVALALGTMDSNSRWQRIQHERKLVTFHRSDRVINFGLASLARSADFQQGAARRFVVELRGDSGDAHNGDLLEFEGAIEAVQRMASFYRP